MYGFRDAANGCFEDWHEFLGTHNYKTGIANPARILNAQRGLHEAVHGDDFYVLGRRRDLDDMTALLKSKYSVRETHRLGFGHGCVQEDSRGH